MHAQESGISLEEIAEALEKKPKQLYNHDTDSGPLYHLMKEGLVSRYDNFSVLGKWSWQARGAITRVEWDGMW